MSFCKHKDIFGKPNEGVHSYRLFNIAIVDLVFTIIGAYLLSLYFTNYNFFTILFVLLVLALLLHKLFCVDTTVTVAVFGEN
jgi:uncharacterized membrane protein